MDKFSILKLRAHLRTVRKFAELGIECGSVGLEESELEKAVAIAEDMRLYFDKQSEEIGGLSAMMLLIIIIDSINLSIDGESKS